MRMRIGKDFVGAMAGKEGKRRTEKFEGEISYH
jgi:hypothetical protein